MFDLKMSQKLFSSKTLNSKVAKQIDLAKHRSKKSSPI